jgi:hypothetical protein
MKVRPMAADLFHEDRRTDRQAGRQTDRQTDVTKLTVAFCSLVNAPKNPLAIVTI